MCITGLPNINISLSSDIVLVFIYLIICCFECYIFPHGSDREQGPWARPVTTQRLFYALKDAVFLQEQDSFPKAQILSHISGFQSNFSSYEQKALGAADRHIYCNAGIFCTSHNKYLSFYRPITSHRNKAIYWQISFYTLS